MKHILIILSSILILGLVSCKPEPISIDSNARLSIKGITFNELSAATALTGKVTAKTYTESDTSGSLIVETETYTFNIQSPMDANQAYDFKLPATIKKITFDISFVVSSSTAGSLSIKDLNFTHNGVSKYSRTNFEIVDRTDEYTLPTVEVNF